MDSKESVLVYYGALGFIHPDKKEEILKERDKVMKDLKVLQIIIDKLVDVYTDIADSWSYEEYIDNFNHEKKNGYRKKCKLLTREEYDLLYDKVFETK